MITINKIKVAFLTFIVTFDSYAISYSEKAFCIEKSGRVDSQHVERSYQSYRKSDYVFMGKVVRIELHQKGSKNEWIIVTVNIDKVYKDKSGRYKRGHKITFKEEKGAYEYLLPLFKRRDVRLIEKNGHLYSSGFNRTYKPEYIEEMLNRNRDDIAKEEADPRFERFRGFGIGG